MKVIPIAMVAFALADMVVFNAVQVPQPDAVFGQDVAWLEGTGAQSRVGLTVLTSELGIQSATPGDWIIGNDVGPVRVMADDQFKLEYAAAPDGAGIVATPPTPPPPAAAVTDATLLGMPAWQSHKIVRAAPIAAISDLVNGETQTCDVTLQLDGSPVYAAPIGTFARYMPIAGDYLVLYDDGYVSVSPKAAFEDGYSAYTPPPADPNAGQSA